MVQGPKVRERGPDDPYAQATLFWNSISEVEQDHIVDAYTFELGKVEVRSVVERMVSRLALVDETLAQRVCFGLGLPAPLPPEVGLAMPGEEPDSEADADEALDATGGVESSPALAMVTANAYPVDGRVVHVLANDGADLAGLRAMQAALLQAGAIVQVVATHKGGIRTGRRGDELLVDRSFHTASSAEADAIIVASGAALANNPAVLTYVQSAYRHYKPIAAWGDATELLTNAGIGLDDPGVVVGDRGNKTFARQVVDSLTVHRHWERADVHPTRLALTEVQ
jgi:catalase